MRRPDCRSERRFIVQGVRARLGVAEEDVHQPRKSVLLPPPTLDARISSNRLFAFAPCGWTSPGGHIDGSYTRFTASIKISRERRATSWKPSSVSAVSYSFIRPVM